MDKPKHFMDYRDVKSPSRVASDEYQFFKILFELYHGLHMFFNLKDRFASQVSLVKMEEFISV